MKAAFSSPSGRSEVGKKQIFYVMKKFTERAAGSCIEKWHRITASGKAKVVYLRMCSLFERMQWYVSFETMDLFRPTREKQEVVERMALICKHRTCFYMNAWSRKAKLGTRFLLRMQQITTMITQRNNATYLAAFNALQSAQREKYPRKREEILMGLARYYEGSYIRQLPKGFYRWYCNSKEFTALLYRQNYLSACLASRIYKIKLTKMLHLLGRSFNRWRVNVVRHDPRY
jgi:hypothetical protein